MDTDRGEIPKPQPHEPSHSNPHLDGNVEINDKSKPAQSIGGPPDPWRDDPTKDPFVYASIPVNTRYFSPRETRQNRIGVKTNDRTGEGIHWGWIKYRQGSMDGYMRAPIDEYKARLAEALQPGDLSRASKRRRNFSFSSPSIKRQALESCSCSGSTSDSTSDCTGSCAGLPMNAQEEWNPTRCAPCTSNRIHCPMASCLGKNNKGKPYARSYIIKHIENAHPEILKPSNQFFNPLRKWLATEMGSRRICVLHRWGEKEDLYFKPKIVATLTSEGCCPDCTRQTEKENRRKGSGCTRDLTEAQRAEYMTKAMEVLTLPVKVHKSVHRSNKKALELAMCKTLGPYANAKLESEAWERLLWYFKLHACLQVTNRRGKKKGKKPEQAAVNKQKRSERTLLSFWVTSTGPDYISRHEIYNRCVGIHKTRAAKKKVGGKVIDEDEKLLRMYTRMKDLVRAGETGKAMQSLVTLGLAATTKRNWTQLYDKYPQVYSDGTPVRDITTATTDRVNELRRECDQEEIEEIANIRVMGIDQRDPVPDSLKMKLTDDEMTKDKAYRRWLKRIARTCRKSGVRLGQDESESSSPPTSAPEPSAPTPLPDPPSAPTSEPDSIAPTSGPDSTTPTLPTEPVSIAPTLPTVPTSDQHPIQQIPDKDDEASMLDVMRQSIADMDTRCEPVRVQDDAWDRIASRTKKDTAAGLDKISPYMFAQAYTASVNGRLQRIMSRIADRSYRAEYPAEIGTILNISKGLMLVKKFKYCKDDDGEDTKEIKKDDEGNPCCDIRPVAIGLSLTRQILKPLSDAVNPELKRITANHQLGYIRDGYAVGAIAAGEIRKNILRRKTRLGASHKSDVILIIDFRNAFNSADRQTMTHLLQALCPRAAAVWTWLYNKPPTVWNGGKNVSGNGNDNILARTGAKQGCILSNIAFACLTKWIDSQLMAKFPLLSNRLWYWDDSTIVGPPEVVAAAAQYLSKLTKMTGLELRWDKCHLHCVDEEAKDWIKSEKLFNEGVELHGSLDFEFLKVPIGCDEFVEKELDVKADELEHQIAMVSQSPDTHETYTLLSTCLTECRVTHLIRVLPLNQLEVLLGRLEECLRRALEKLLHLDTAASTDEVDDTQPHARLSERQWRVAQLSAGFAGLRLKTGQVTAGATRAMTLLKTERDVKKFLREDGEGYCAVTLVKDETTDWFSKALSSTDNTRVEVDMEVLCAKLKCQIRA